MNSKTPAEASYEAWMNAFDRINYLPFDQLKGWNKKMWTAIADAVITQSKTIIVVRRQAHASTTELTPLEANERRTVPDVQQASRPRQAVLLA